MRNSVPLSVRHRSGYSPHCRNRSDFWPSEVRGRLHRRRYAKCCSYALLIHGRHEVPLRQMVPQAITPRIPEVRVTGDQQSQHPHPRRFRHRSSAPHPIQDLPWQHEHGPHQRQGPPQKVPNRILQPYNPASGPTWPYSRSPPDHHQTTGRRKLFSERLSPSLAASRPVHPIACQADPTEPYPHRRGCGRPEADRSCCDAHQMSIS